VSLIEEKSLLRGAIVDLEQALIIVEHAAPLPGGTSRYMSIPDVEAKLARVCRAVREAIRGENEAPDRQTRKFWRGQRIRANTSRHTLAEVLGLLSGDPADDHYYDRLEAWEREALKPLGPAR